MVKGLPVQLVAVRNQEYGITWGNTIPSNNLLNEFEDNDPRYKFTFYEEGDQILTKSPLAPLTLTSADMNIAPSLRKGVSIKRFFRKYNIYDYVNSGFHPGGINQRVIRYADVLLMLAECEAEAGTPAKAASYINEVRSRESVKMPAVNPTNK